MNVLDIFSAAANFTGIAYNNYMRIGNIVQNAKIEVDEIGTIAAAVSGNITGYYLYNLLQYIPVYRLFSMLCARLFTELTVIPLMGMSQTFIANRPFIFAIVDVPTGETLFAGRVMDPSAKSSSSTYK